MKYAQIVFKHHCFSRKEMICGNSPEIRVRGVRRSDPVQTEKFNTKMYCLSNWPHSPDEKYESSTFIFHRFNLRVLTTENITLLKLHMVIYCVEYN